MAKQPTSPRITSLRTSLLHWFKKNQRDLPWRRSQEPYKIWISEVMLQQTTTQAVIPYYERFLQTFPTLKSLALAPEKKVLQAWAGLGYYSRARNLHKASQSLHQHGFPQSAEELLALPGFGPYTSRAVSSLAFGEKVGVLDGNVIRILSRVFGQKWQWWQTKDRQILQETADSLAQSQDSSSVNQGMMELGATICTPQSPSCFLCPWNRQCQALRQGTIDSLPLKKPKAPTEILLWTIDWIQNKQKVAFVVNHYAPFLKKGWLPPGTIQHLNKRPEKFDVKHAITKYEIYARIRKTSATAKGFSKQEQAKWFDVSKITEEIPYSLIHKVLRRTLETPNDSSKPPKHLP